MTHFLILIKHLSPYFLAGFITALVASGIAGGSYRQIRRILFVLRYQREPGHFESLKDLKRHMRQDAAKTVFSWIGNVDPDKSEKKVEL